MTKTKKIVLLVAVVVIVALLVVAFITGGATEAGIPCPDCDGTVADCETCGGEGNVLGSLWALLPPLIAIGLALITKEVYSSLFIGIAVGGVLYSGFSFTGTLDSVINDGLISAVAGTAGIFVFLVILGILVSMINKSGGTDAFGRWAKKHVNLVPAATATVIPARICPSVLQKAGAES